jgi:hypothetical protein
MMRRITIFLAGMLVACGLLFATSPQKATNTSAAQAARINNLGGA